MTEFTEKTHIIWVFSVNYQYEYWFPNEELKIKAWGGTIIIIFHYKENYRNNILKIINIFLNKLNYRTYLFLSLLGVIVISSEWIYIKNIFGLSQSGFFLYPFEISSKFFYNPYSYYSFFTRCGQKFTIVIELKRIFKKYYLIRFLGKIEKKTFSLTRSFRLPNEKHP